MARRYSRSASKDVERVMRKRKRGTLKSGSGRKVKSRKQAIAIGLSEARKKGKGKSSGEAYRPQEEIASARRRGKSFKRLPQGPRLLRR